MQAPVRDSRHDGVARQARAVQEEQQRHGQVGDPAERDDALPVGGRQAGDDDGGDEQERETIGRKRAMRCISWRRR